MPPDRFVRLVVRELPGEQRPRSRSSGVKSGWAGSGGASSSPRSGAISQLEVERVLQSSTKTIKRCPTACARPLDCFHGSCRVTRRRHSPRSFRCSMPTRWPGAAPAIRTAGTPSPACSDWAPPPTNTRYARQEREGHGTPDGRRRAFIAGAGRPSAGWTVCFRTLGSRLLPLNIRKSATGRPPTAQRAGARDRPDLPVGSNRAGFAALHPSTAAGSFLFLLESWLAAFATGTDQPTRRCRWVREVGCATVRGLPPRICRRKVLRRRGASWSRSGGGRSEDGGAVGDRVAPVRVEEREATASREHQLGPAAPHASLGPPLLADRHRVETQAQTRSLRSHRAR